MLLLYTKFNVFLSLNFGWTVNTDLLLRSNLNDSIFNRYHFFWTSFYYLPVLYFNTLLIILIISLRFLYTVLLLVYIILLIFYNLELQDFLILNCNLWVFDYYRVFTNVLLTNTLNKYHPYIFYVGTLFIFTKFIIGTYFTYERYNYYALHKYLTWVNYLNPILLVSFIITLFMGGWWALQEGSWGGWWDWDPSEMLGLFFLLIILTYVHTIKQLYRFYRFYWKYTLLILIVLLCYSLVQLNFEFVAHNFGIKSFLLLNNNSIFLEMLLIISLSLIFFVTQITLNFNYWFILSKFRTVYSIRGTTVLNFTLFLTVLLVLYFLFTFTALINYFNNNFWTVDVTSIKKCIKVLNILNLILMMSYFYNYKLVNLLIICFCFLYTSNTITYLICVFLLPKTLWTVIHNLLIIFFLSNLQLNDLTVNVNNFWTSLTGVVIFNDSYYITDKLYSCDSFNIETTQFLTTSYMTSLISWNTIVNGNVFEVDAFTLGFNSMNFWNFYNTNLSYYLETQLISYTGLELLFIVVIMLLLLINKAFFKVIIFKNY